MGAVTKIWILAIIAILISATAAAFDSELEIEKIEVSSLGKTILSTSSDDGNIDVEPDTELRVRVTLENTYDEDTNNDMTDVLVIAQIRGMNDDDTTDYSDRLEIRAEGKRTVTLTLKVPEEASNFQSYDLEVSAKGYDEDGKMHTDSASFELEVERDEHKLEFETFQVSDARCEERPTVRIELVNTGETEEEDVKLRLTNPALGTVFTDEFDLESITDYSTAEYELDKKLDIEGLPKGRHTLKAEVTYGDGKVLRQETDFFAEGCGQSSEAYKDYSYDEDDRRVFIATERYNNPKRDLSFLSKPDVQPIEVDVFPEWAPKPPRVAEAKVSILSIFALLFANIAIFIFIILLVMPLIEKEDEDDKGEELNFINKPLYK